MKRQSLALGLVAGSVALSLAACAGQGVTAVPTPVPAAAQPIVAAPTAVTIDTGGLGQAASTTFVLGTSGIGEVKAAQDADLTFGVQGTVEAVPVKEGDSVKKGDLLAILDVRGFDQQLQQAQAQLKSAQAAATGLVEAPRDFDATAAQAAVSAAAAQVASLKAGAKVQDLQTAQAAVAAAQANLQSTHDKLSAMKTTAETQMQQAVEGLTAAQARYAQAKSNWEYVQETGNDPIQPNVTTGTGAKVPNKSSGGSRENYYSAFVQAEAAMNQADQSLQAAKVNYDTARQGEVTGINAAEQQLVQAQAALDKLQLPPDKAAMAQAQSALAQAQAAKDRLTAAPRDSQQAQAEAGIAQAQAALELAKINRERAELRAPFDGVIATVSVDPGDSSSAGGQSAIRIVDISDLGVEVQISDSDIGKVALGQQATVTTDAIPDREFLGKVSYIAPTATTNGTLRSYKVRVALDEQDGLRSGMSARVEIAPQN